MEEKEDSQEESPLMADSTSKYNITAETVSPMKRKESSEKLKRKLYPLQIQNKKQPVL